MKTSQCNQLKLLSALLERETADVMRRLEAVRRSEVKALSKVHRDKDEMVRDPECLFTIPIYIFQCLMNFSSSLFFSSLLRLYPPVSSCQLVGS
jgi:hypothetical protein